MELPDFNGFVSTAQQAVMEWAVTTIDGRKLCNLSLPGSPEDMSQFATSILTTAYEMNMTLLRAYHSWLAEELSKGSDRQAEQPAQ